MEEEKLFPPDPRPSTPPTQVRRYDHKLPSAIPTVKNNQAVYRESFIDCFTSGLSLFPVTKPASSREKAKKTKDVP